MDVSDVKALLSDRIRSPEEIAAYRQGLEEFAGAVTDIPWFLARGALLGAYRDGDLIPHDSDIDMEVSAKYRAHAKRISRRLKKTGFDVVTMYRDDKLQKIYGCKYGLVYVLRFWDKKGDMWYCRKLKMPDRYFNNHGTVELKGNKYPCPGDIEGYLEYIFGDWQTRIDKKGKPW